MPAFHSPEGSVCSTDSTQPYLAQRATEVDPRLVVNYYNSLPSMSNLHQGLRPGPVDEGTRAKNPAFYDSHRTDNAQTFNKDLLRSGHTTGQRLGSVFGKPNAKKVGFHGPPISDTSDGVSKDSRYFYKDEKPEVQYTLRSTQPAHSTGSYAPGKSIRSPRDSPASRYADSGRARSPRPSNEHHSDNPQYGYQQPRSTYEATPSWPTSRRDSPSAGRYNEPRPDLKRHQSKQLYGRKSSVHYDDPSISPRSPLRDLTRSRQNSIAGLSPRYRKAKPEASDVYQSSNRWADLIITVPTAYNEAYRNRLWPRGEYPSMDSFEREFLRLNGFGYRNYMHWYKRHWGPSS